MTSLNTLSVLEDEFGAAQCSGLSGQSLYFSAKWEELCEEACLAAREAGRSEPDDVRLADLALDLVGISHQWVEAEINEDGDWMVYWC